MPTSPAIGESTADFAQQLIAQAQKLYAQENWGMEMSNTVYALDSTTIDLCLSEFRGPTSAQLRLP